MCEGVSPPRARARPVYGEQRLTCFYLTVSVSPGEILFAPDVLNATQAVFIGIQMDSLYGPLNTWQFVVRSFSAF